MMITRNNKTSRFQLALTPQDLLKWGQFANKENVSLAFLVREAVEKFMNEKESENENY